MAAQASAGVTISVVIPVYNEEGNIAPVVDDCCRTLNDLFGNHEIIVVDDASTDNTAHILRTLKGEVPYLKVIRNDGNIGCHPSVRRGFDEAQGDWLLFLPGDRQIRADSLFRFLARSAGADMVCSYRRRRADPRYRIWVSRLYNLVARLVTGVGFRDFDSSILIRREAYRAVAQELAGHTASLSIELVVRVLGRGYRVAEVEIEHFPRVTGKARGLNWRDASRVPINLVRATMLARRTRARTRLGSPAAPVASAPRLDPKRAGSGNIDWRSS